MELDQLYDWIPALVIYIKHLRKVYDNEKMTQNISARQDMDPEQIYFFFIKLYGFIQCQKTDSKDILDTNKLLKTYVQYLLEWDINRQPYQDHKWIKEGAN